MADWSPLENEVIVTEYLDMLEQELAGQPYVKARANERVRQIGNRSKGSVEWKFRNVSAVLQDMRMVPIHGYLPASNAQSDLTTAVERELERRQGLVELMRQRVESPATSRHDVEWRVVRPPVDLVFTEPRGERRAIHTDFAQVEAANRSLGLAGEHAVLEREIRLLHEAGRDDLAEQVIHVSVREGDGLGYDIASFSPDGKQRLIEVKSTRLGETWPMIVTRNEVRVSQSEENYVLARVFNFAQPRVGLYELPGPIPDNCILDPETWRALPRTA